MDSRHVAQVGHVRVAVREHGGRESGPSCIVFGVELAVPRGLPAERLPRHGSRLYPAAYAPESHSTILKRSGFHGQVTGHKRCTKGY